MTCPVTKLVAEPVFFNSGSLMPEHTHWFSKWTAHRPHFSPEASICAAEICPEHLSCPMLSAPFSSHHHQLWENLAGLGSRQISFLSVEVFGKQIPRQFRMPQGTTPAEGSGNSTNGQREKPGWVQPQTTSADSTGALGLRRPFEPSSGGPSRPGLPESHNHPT